MVCKVKSAFLFYQYHGGIEIMISELILVVQKRNRRMSNMQKEQWHQTTCKKCHFSKMKVNFKQTYKLNENRMEATR
jgi:hypothetical protein